MKTTNGTLSKYAVAPAIVTSTGKLVVGKRRVEHFQKKSPKAKVVVQTKVDWAQLPYLIVVRDAKGRLHLTTRREAKRQGWEEVRS